MSTSQEIPHPSTQPQTAPPQASHMPGTPYVPMPHHPVHMPYYIQMAPPAPHYDHHLSRKEEVDLRVRAEVLEREVETLAREKANAELSLLTLSNLNPHNIPVATKPGEGDDTAGALERIQRLERENVTLRAQLLETNKLFVELTKKTVGVISSDNATSTSGNGTTLVGKGETKLADLLARDKHKDRIAQPTKKTEEWKGENKEIGKVPQDDAEEEDDDANEEVPPESSSYDSEYHESLTGSFQSQSMTEAHNHIVRFKKEEIAVEEAGIITPEVPSLPSSAPSLTPGSWSSSRFNSPVIPGAPTMPKADFLHAVFAPHQRNRNQRQRHRGRGQARYSSRDHESSNPDKLQYHKPKPYFNDHGPTDTHQLRYIPVDSTNVYRTVIITNLPSTTKIEQIFSFVRGGIIIKATLMETSAIFKEDTKSALVWFWQESAARAFVEWAKRTRLEFEGISLDVQLVKTPTFRVDGDLSYDIEVVGKRRAFTLHNLPDAETFDNIRYDLFGPTASEKNAPMGFILREAVHVCKNSMKSNMETMQPVRNKQDVVTAVHFRFTSVKYAILASKVLSQGFYRDCRIEWGGDPCEIPVKEDEDLNVAGVGETPEEKRGEVEEGANEEQREDFHDASEWSDASSAVAGSDMEAEAQLADPDASAATTTDNEKSAIDLSTNEATINFGLVDFGVSDEDHTATDTAALVKDDESMVVLAEKEPQSHHVEVSTTADADTEVDGIIASLEDVVDSSTPDETSSDESTRDSNTDSSFEDDDKQDHTKGDSMNALGISLQVELNNALAVESPDVEEAIKQVRESEELLDGEPENNELRDVVHLEREVVL